MKEEPMVMDELRRVALFTSGVAELTRHQAEQIVKDLVRSGDVRRKQASDATKELVKRSRQNRKELVKFVRSEIQNQIENLGLATKRDLERIERRVNRLETERKAAKTSRGRSGGASSPRKRPAAGRRTTGAAKTAQEKTTARPDRSPAPGEGNSAPGPPPPS